MPFIRKPGKKYNFISKLISKLLFQPCRCGRSWHRCCSFGGCRSNGAFLL